MTDTVKLVREGRIERTVDRDALVRAQTPQCADLQLLRGALYDAVQAGEKVTDESFALERMGLRPAAVVCTGANLKITTPDDLIAAAALLEAKE